MKEMTDARWNELLDKQRLLEDEGTTGGVQRFKERVRKATEKGRGSTVGGSKKLLLEAIEPMEKALEWKLAQVVRGRRPTAFKWIRLAGPDVVAYLTTRAVLDQIHVPVVPATALALKISQYILDELRYRRFETLCPDLFKYKLKTFRTQSYAHMSRSMSAAMGTATYKDEEGVEHKVDVSDLDMSIEDRMQVGYYLLNVFHECTGMIEFHLNAKKENRTVKPTRATLEWIAKRNDVLAMVAPKKMPMVVPPLPWSQTMDGGYRFALRQQNMLVRGMRTKTWKRELRQISMPVVYEALNRIQETAWRINTDVFDLVTRLRVKGNIAGIPSSEPLPKTPKPLDIDTNVEAKRAWKKKEAARIGEDVERVQRCLELSRILDVAEALKDEEAIWFPYNCDFRGRVYPVSDYLQPQGSDVQKALLTFAEGRPVGTSGIKWLAIHGINCLDKTPEGEKVSHWTHDERLRWINEHTKDIIRVAEDPFSANWWMDAEDPLQFYAFCCEWKRLQEAPVKEEYICSLPVGMDGSCNGLQHFAALLLDAVGGKAVNVTANARPSDVYQNIADSVMDLCIRDAAFNRAAKLWLTSKLIDRKLTKRPTMTFGYGSRQYGFNKQLMEDLTGRENWPEIRQHFTVEVEPGVFRCVIAEACSYMAACIWNSLGDVVVAAFGGMEWLRKSARIVCKATEWKPIEWTVPATGFRVRQEYYEMDVKRVKTMLCGNLTFPRLLLPREQEADRTKQQSAIAPNVIHSLDAAALMLTVQMAANDGVYAFGMIHDSYSTVPGDAATLAASTREAFVRLYQERDVAGFLWKQFQEMAGEEEVPSPPVKGDLKLIEVLASDYFFS